MNYTLNADGWTALIIMQGLVVLGALEAWEDKFCLPSQMINQKGFSRGLPFICHFGMWGDLLIVSPLVIIIWNTYASQWSGDNKLMLFLVGTAISLLMHLWYMDTPFPEAHTYGHMLSRSGLVHVIYMALALGVFLIYFFSYQPIEPKFAVVFALGLAVHLFFGTHCVLGIWNPAWYGQKPLQSLGTWIVLIPSWSILALWTYIVVSNAAKFSVD